ncbi:hypothetical protein LIER_14746 [Lithospermum erythrorhizon]|uniref:Gag-pol polyprotein n=1 Tax=Lithospermum erythrorhizon TaxID=34254 RepID=A0AAV3Q4D4_LITER
MINEKLVRKILRTLPKKFAHKVTAIEEAQDLTTMRVDELMGNLSTFEISLDDGDLSKKKGIALKVASEDVDNEDLVEIMNLLAKNFNKSLKRFNKKPYGGTNFPSASDKGNNRWKKPKQSKNYYTTLIDDDSDEEDGQEEKVSNFVVFTAQTKPHVNDSSHENSEDEEDMTEEEMLEDYKLMYTKLTELTGVFTKSEAEKCKL